VNSNSIRELCSQQNCCSYISAAMRFNPGFPDEHVADQAHCIFLPGGESVVDYIGSTETIEQDWLKIVGEINRYSGSNFVPQPLKNPNGRGSKGHGSIETWCMDAAVIANLNETTSRNIARQYAMDVLLFGYL
jgi:hypothetical protein